jgi:hypothetical protein
MLKDSLFNTASEMSKIAEGSEILASFDGIHFVSSKEWIKRMRRTAYRHRSLLSITLYFSTALLFIYVPRAIYGSSLSICEV